MELNKTIKALIKKHGIHLVIDAIAAYALEKHVEYRIRGSSFRGYKQMYDKLKQI